MRIRKVFIASSIVDLAYERNRLVMFFSKLSKAVDTVRFVPYICEQSSKSIARVRKQDEYNSEIESSNLFVLIATSRIGNYTLEEFKVALASQRRSDLPLIAVFYESQYCRQQLIEASGDKEFEGLMGYYRSLPELEIALLNLLSNQYPDANREDKADGSIWVNGYRIVSGYKLHRAKESRSNA